MSNTQRPSLQRKHTRTTKANKAEALAWQYDKFLHCAVPDIDKLKDGQALLEFIAAKCTRQKGKEIDVEFLD